MNNYITERPEHPIERLMNDSFGSLRALVDADTVIGSPINTSEGLTVIPVSRVAVGFMTGGGEYADLTTGKKNKDKDDLPFAGASGGGVTVSPIGFLVSDNGSLKMLTLEGENAYDKLLSLIPDTLQSLIKGMKS